MCLDVLSVCVCVCVHATFEAAMGGRCKWPWAVAMEDWNPQIRRFDLQFTEEVTEKDFISKNQRQTIRWWRRANLAFLTLILADLMLSFPALLLILRVGPLHSTHIIFLHSWVTTSFGAGICVTGAIFTSCSCIERLEFQVIERLIVMEATLNAIGAFSSDYYYAGRMQGFPRDDLVEASCDVSEGRLYLHLCLTAVVAHFQAPVRWRILMILNIVYVCIIAFAIAVGGSSEKQFGTTFMNVFFYIAIVISCSLSKRRLEYRERCLVLESLQEKILRVEAEFKTSQAESTNPQLERQRSRHDDNISSAIFNLASSLGDDESSSVHAEVEDVRQTQLHAMSIVADIEGWCIDFGDLLLGRDILGNGGFGVVVKGQLHEKPVAIKCPLFKGVHHGKALKLLASEVRMLRHIRHENIVHFLGSCILSSEQTVLLVEEFVPGGTLENLIRMQSLEAQELYAILLGIVTALRYLHSQMLQMIHGDLKPSNVLMDTTQRIPKLTDFGMCQTVRSFKKYKGFSSRYAAPEVILGEETQNPQASDMFSFGSLVYFVLTRRHPGSQKSSKEIIKLARDGHVVVLDWSNPSCALELHNASESCRAFNKDDRPSAFRMTDLLRSLLQDSGPSRNAFSSQEEAEEVFMDQLSSLLAKSPQERLTAL
eukprot:TRINITY_DN7805_c0_g1_i1.p1 TRINITY_DN7805_c0_g1~~TRINITY_DN7805_c0_g1_i1.p1  ORF type:complete len:654 (+),score=80.46 TRINITY_DN7805_c0_g1_i1:176-2137(+)